MTEKIHPAYEPNLHINDESKEAKRMAGVTTREQIMQRLENEGRSSKCENAAMYVKMHKSIIVPEYEINGSIKKQCRKGWIGDKVFTFIDDDGNIAKVDIDYEEIASIKVSEYNEVNDRQFVKEMKVYGFDISSSYDDRDYQYRVFPEIRAFRDKVKKDLEDLEDLEVKKKKEWRF